MENLFQTRRMFGGGLSHVWPFAVVANHYFDGFTERYGQAVQVSEKVIGGLGTDDRVQIKRIPNGTNIFLLRVKQGDPATFQERLRAAGMVVPNPQGDQLLLSVNETWNRVKPGEILEKMRQALG
jgi:threonine aldolase